MEKTIENIWKEGFLKNDALVAPKINNLYSRKSMHIIDKFKRMFRVNLVVIVAFSFVFLLVSYFLGIGIMGVIFFLTLIPLVVINRRLLKNLEKIDKGENSYQYLKSFNRWIKKQVELNKRMSAILYPIFFVALVLGLWFKDVEGISLGERLVSKILSVFPDTTLVFGIPVLIVLPALFIIGLLAILGGRIYQWDVNIVYGRIFKKLEELLTDIEELNV